ncbi:MAG TPA: 8-amino-7-oxononanoate synthase [Anaerohalosphaeraceae bacterium]|nr:8-amino-7-oxononanoate synthase [Anaerohalosphaeraceae bacterium]HPB92460.1 8-amino-7-oxononanoate synthase [Anaerohalosphaeraceae bacterium]
MKKFEDFGQKLDNLRDNNLFRRLRTMLSVRGTAVRTAEEPEQEKVLFCSNNYLNLAEDKRVAEAAVEAIHRYGFGAGASRLISGTILPHTRLEEEFARWVGKEKSLYFPSGWSANQSILTTLPQKGDLVLMDHRSHASIVDAVRNSGADFRTYRNEQDKRLARQLAEPKYRRKYIVTESVFSMDGDWARLEILAELRERYDAVLILDEAHGLGCFGPTGAGLAEEMGLLEKVDVFTAPLGKAVGCAGALVASNSLLIDYLINCARPFIYTTAAPPSCAAGALAAIQIIQNEPKRRRHLQENAAYLRQRLKQMGLNIGQTSSQIVPVIVGSSEKALQWAQQLEAKGYFITAIRPPTVPSGSARLRISVQYGHTKGQIDGLCAAIQELAAQ